MFPIGSSYSRPLYTLDLRQATNIARSAGISCGSGKTSNGCFNVYSGYSVKILDVQDIHRTKRTHTISFEYSAGGS